MGTMTENKIMSILLKSTSNFLTELVCLLISRGGWRGPPQAAKYVQSHDQPHESEILNSEGFAGRDGSAGESCRGRSML